MYPQRIKQYDKVTNSFMIFHKIQLRGIMMKLYRQNHILIILFLLCIIILLGLYRYTKQVDRVLADITINTMQEISAHDSAFVENTLERSCNSLLRVGERLRAGNYQSLRDLQNQLNIEHTATSFTHLYLIDSVGKMYSGTFLIQDGTIYPYVKGILQGIPKQILRFDDYQRQVDYQEESIVYALSIPPFEADGIHFVGLVGQTTILDIREHMNRTSFDGQGTSMVIDTDGYYVVNKSNKNGIGQHDNLLENLKRATFFQGASLEEIRSHLKSGNDFICTYTLDGMQYVLSMKHLNSTDWYLAMSVPEKVFTEQSRQFMWLTSGSLIGAFFLCLLLLGCLIFTWRKSLLATANAAARYAFLNRMSHEIRTPLNAIIGLNHLMRKSLDEPHVLQEYLEKSAITSEYLLGLINDVLDISKLEQKSVSLSHEPLSLNKMTDNLQSILKEQLQEKEIHFHIKTVFLQPFIWGDELRLKQVLLNILGNAIKFTPAQGKITMELEQYPLRDASRVLTKVTITDNGIGMSEEFQKHIFESFTQEKKEANRHLKETSTRGTGLGMAISYLLIKKMGGQMSVKSILGKGSRFTVLFPADIAEETAEETLTIPQTTTVQMQKRPPNILVAEDNELNAEILTAILEKAGCSVILAQNGQLAVDYFLEKDPYTFDIILMDAQMPVMDGFTAAQTIRRLNRPDAVTIPIYATTANTAPEDREQAKNAGMTGFIAKPIDVKKLLKIINYSTPDTAKEEST